MARRTHDGYSNSADEQGGDVTAQFWGSSPEWRTTGTQQRARRNGDRTGPVERTRRHGDRTGQIPVVSAAPIEEPLIDPYDFGFDDVGYGPDPGIAARRLDTRSRTSAAADLVEQSDHVELLELDEHRAGSPGDPVSTLAARLGLGAVDPLLLRLGAIVMIGVLLVPLAMGMRSESSEGSVRTETEFAGPTEVISPGDVPVVEEDASSQLTGDDSTPLLPTTAPQTTASTAPPQPAAEMVVATEQSEDGASVGDVTESIDEAQSVAETVQAPPAPVETHTEVAEADEPAYRVAPVCQLSYTVAAGDYWIRIADAAGTTLARLLQVNSATVATALYPGDDICLPEGASLPAPPTATTSAPPTTQAAPVPSTTVAPSTTAAPTTTAPVVTAPPAPGVIQEIIREVWPDDLEERALEIAWRESGYLSSAQNWCCYGLFQIHWSAHRSWLDDLGITSTTQLLDARTNVRAAYTLYQRSGGWGPWGG